MPNTAVVNNPTAFHQFLGELSGDVAALVAGADRMIRSVDPLVTQVLWPHQKTLGYGIGPRKMSEHYAYIDIYERHINLGFNYGASLPDPSHLLGGSGKSFRSMRITATDQLDDPALRDLLRAAHAEREQNRRAPSA